MSKNKSVKGYIGLYEIDNNGIILDSKTGEKVDLGKNLKKENTITLFDESGNDKTFLVSTLLRDNLSVDIPENNEEVAEELEAEEVIEVVEFTNEDIEAADDAEKSNMILEEVRNGTVNYRYLSNKYGMSIADIKEMVES